ncbi:MAG: ATP-binding cassette domain-containing protein, partial [Candidatus Promineifilaceae bacterium]
MNDIAERMGTKTLEQDSTTSFIHVSGLQKSFQEGTQTRKVLKNVEASFARGESAAIVGQSGSGKSTLLNVICGIDESDAGVVSIGGQDLTKLNEQKRTLFRRRHIGVIFQFFNLIPTLTVWENVVLPLELSGYKNSDLVEKAEPLLDAVGLLHRRETFPDRLSGGEQQRVAIARALANDPLLVLADEPTGNLDEETSRRVLELLDKSGCERYLRERNYPLPATWLLSEKTWDATIESVTFPAIAKPSRPLGEFKALRLADRDELTALAARHPQTPLVVQEWIPGG